MDARFDGLVPLRQQRKGTCRYDMAFQLRSGLSLVEIKKTELGPHNVSQLLRYCRIWGRSKVHPLAKRHYLIGRRPSDVSQLQAALNRSTRDIRLLFIGTDIPWYLAMVGRHYVPYTEGYAKNVVHLRL